MILKIFQLIFLIILIFPFTLLKGQDLSKLKLVVNMENKHELPRNFRMTHPSYLSQDFFKDPLESKALLYGLFDLKASASGQFSKLGLLRIKEIISNQPLLVIDLREESHGFINGIAVSWHGEKGWSNRDKTLHEIVYDEKSRLENLLNKNDILLYHKKSCQVLKIDVKDVYSEKELADSLGIKYIRLPVTDHLKPSDEQVDHFIELIKNHALANSSFWLHFHCAAGRGRATSFMAMYDMMKHASQVSFKHILSRQALLGGKDLSEPFPPSDWRYSHHFERLEFLTNFYNYCLENPHFEQPWSSWKQNITK